MRFSGFSIVSVFCASAGSYTYLVRSQVSYAPTCDEGYINIEGTNNQEGNQIFSAAFCDLHFHPQINLILCYNKFGQAAMPDSKRR
jgi:hypothetical protein